MNYSETTPPYTKSTGFGREGRVREKDRDR